MTSTKSKSKVWGNPRVRAGIGLIALISLVFSGVYYLKPTPAANQAAQKIIQSQSGDKSEASTTPEQQAEITVKTLSNLIVGPQTAGNSVIVDAVTNIDPGFIVVQAVDKAGKLGKTVAQSKYLSAGKYQDLDLPGKIEAGQMYSVVLFKDSNGNKKLDNADELVLNGSQPVNQIFTVAAK